MKVERKPDPGIFEEVSLKAESPRDVQELFEALSKRTIESLLGYRENEALRILRENGIQSHPCIDREPVSPITKDASDLIYSILGTRHWISRGDIKSAALCALEVGCIATRMQIRPLEKFVITGRKVRRKNADARDSEGLKLAKEWKAQEYELWARCAAEYRARHPKHSDWEVARYIARKLRTPQKPDTIRRKLRKITGKV